MSDLNTKNIKAFIQRCLLERDELLSAVSHDKFEMAYQQQLREWHSGASGGGWCPTGKTVEVCDRFRPQVGYGACHHLYQQANADARESHAAPVLLPMLNAAWNCQVELYGQARVASEQSRKDVACLTQHSEAFCRLIDVVNRDGPNHQKGESRSEKQPSVTSAEAEEVTKRLYHQLEGKTANYWAKEIRSETGKKCSESLVKGLPLWKQHMERKGKSAGGRTVVGLDALGPVMSEAPTPDEQIAQNEADALVNRLVQDATEAQRTVLNDLDDDGRLWVAGLTKEERHKWLQGLEPSELDTSSGAKITERKKL